MEIIMIGIMTKKRTISHIFYKYIYIHIYKKLVLLCLFFRCIAPLSVTLSLTDSLTFFNKNFCSKFTTKMSYLAWEFCSGRTKGRSTWRGPESRGSQWTPSGSPPSSTSRPRLNRFIKNNISKVRISMSYLCNNYL